jgi:hypothetical protein
LNLKISFCEYKSSLTNAQRSQLTENFIPEEFSQPSAFILKTLCLSLREFVETASTCPQSPRVDTLFAKFKRQAEAFVVHPTRQRRSVQRSRKSTQKKIVKSQPHRDTQALLNLEPPVLLQLLKMSGHEHEDEAKLARVKIPREVGSKAKTLDFSPIELMAESPTIAAPIPLDHSRQTSVAIGRFQAKQIANRNELLRWSTANLTPLKIKGTIARISALAQMGGDVGLGASYLLLSLATGRCPDSLIGRIGWSHGAVATEEDIQLDNTGSKSKPIVILHPSINCISLLVNTPPVLKESDWEAVTPRGSYVIVPDYLKVSAYFKSQLQELGISTTDINTLNREIVLQSITRAGLALQDLGVSTSQLWQALPRIMQSESGMNTAMSLLTDWSTQNSLVELHYHCVLASRLAARYLAAMDALLDYDKRYLSHEMKLPQQNHFVGSPNLIAEKPLRKLLAQIESKLASQTSRLKHDNLMTLYTIMFLTAGCGFRHAVSPTITMYPFRDQVIFSYVEKGSLRQLILPKLVQEQVAVFQKMRSVPLAIDSPKLHSNELSFFMVDDSYRVRALHPGRFTAELAEFGIDFRLELNSMRRWLFSSLFNSGERGIRTDIYGGHGVAGREPFSTYSSTAIHELQAVAVEVDNLLRDAGWRVLH